MEDVPVGERKTAFDAQVTVRIGSFGLDGERACVVLLHSDFAVKHIQRIVGNGVEFDVRIAENLEVVQTVVSERNILLPVWTSFQDVDGLCDGLGFDVRLPKIEEIELVWEFSSSNFCCQDDGIGWDVVHPTEREVGVDIDVVDVVTPACKFVVCDAHGHFHCVVVEAAIDVVVYVIASKEVVSGISQVFSDLFTLGVHGIGVVDVAHFYWESIFESHDVSRNDTVFDVVVDFTDAIGP